MAASELQLLAWALTGAVAELDEQWDRLFERDDGSTAWVNASRLLRVRQAIAVVGAFALLETVIQSSSLESVAADQSADDETIELAKALDVRFAVFRNAVNVLKHGSGRSHDWLIARSDSLPFRVRPVDISRFEEGDVSEGWWLIDIDNVFILEVVSLIEDIDALRIKIGIF